jgi:hypothetical protein
MNSRTRLACGVAIGYVLGRTRKMRLALMLAGATGAAGNPRQLVARGLKQLGSVPEVGKLTTMARGQLVDAAKTAAMTAASSRIDALNERLLAMPGDGDDEKPRRSAGKGRADSDDTGAESSAGADEERYDEEPDEEPAEDNDADGAEDSAEDSADDGDEDGGDESPRPRRRASGTSRRRASTDDSGDKPRRSSTRRSTRTPVRRAGR